MIKIISLVTMILFAFNAYAYDLRDLAAFLEAKDRASLERQDNSVPSSTTNIFIPSGKSEVTIKGLERSDEVFLPPSRYSAADSAAQGFQRSLRLNQEATQQRNDSNYRAIFGR